MKNFRPCVNCGYCWIMDDGVYKSVRVGMIGGINYIPKGCLLIVKWEEV